MSKKSIDDLIRSVDEPEDSLDTPQKKEAPEVKAETPEPTPVEQPDTRAEPEDDKDKSGLPPWMHARVKAAAEAKTAAEKRAEEAERRAAERERQLQEMQQALQQQGYQQPQPSLQDAFLNLKSQQDRQIKDTQILISRRMAAAEYGEETVDQALKWATDRCDADPQFNDLMWKTPEPAFVAVREFQKAQTLMELDKYGGDINKLIEARLAERGVQTDAPASPQVNQRKMPSNFSTAPAATAQRGGPAFKGPTPLGDLLKS